VFAALLLRDLVVVRRELPFFLIRTTMQPILFTVVFGYLLPKMGFVRADYTAALLPGIIGVSIALSAIQSVSLPMVADFGYTNEIEDRLLAPIPVRLVAVEKIVAGTIQGVFAGLFVFPIARLIMGPIPGLTVVHFGEALAVTVLGAAAFAAIGLVLGTVIQGQHIGLMFGFIVAPMIMFGCAYYPWSGLSAVLALKYAVLINPLVYVSEGMRAVLTPGVPHMPLLAAMAALSVITIVASLAGLRTFLNRALS
jgi:ABC-2 type transport system permease protein